MADKTAGSLPAVMEAAIGDLPGIASLYDDTLLPVEQQGEAMHMTGRQWKAYAQASVSQDIADAKGAAAAAEKALASVAAASAEASRQAENAAGSAETARQYSGKPPIIQDGRWWTWDAGKQIYTDTGEPACGNLMYAAFFVDAATGELYMITDNRYTGPGFRLADGDLEVVLRYGN